jgi:Holliday junction DNA helicase RuvB
MNNLRPDSFDEFVGNNKIIQQAKYLVTVASMKSEPLGHMMLGGTPGSGKTSLCRVIANEMHERFLERTFTPMSSDGEPISLKDVARLVEDYEYLRNPVIVETSGNALKNNLKLVEVVKELTGKKEILKFNGKNNKTGMKEWAYESPKILYCDEIHSLRPKVQDDLLLLLEQFILNVSSDNMEYDSGRYGIRPFTFIASTTDPGRLAPVLLSRFSTTLMFDDYSFEDLVQIAKNCIKKIDAGASIQDSAAKEIAKRSKGVARIITQHCEKTYDRMLLDWNTIKNSKRIITKKHVDEIFELFDINNEGLQSASDIKVLQVLALNYPNSVGGRSLGEMAGMDSIYIEKMIEPNLIKLGFIQRLPKGRVLTDSGYKYLKEKSMLPETVTKQEEDSFLPLKKR